MKELKTEGLLIKLRKEHSFTQNDLAEKLGVSFQAVSKWERGENLPDSMMLLEIADLYHITVDELLRGELIKKPVTEEPMLLRNILITLGVAIFMASPIVYMLLEDYNENLATIATLCVVSVGTILFVYLGLKYSDKSTEQLSKLNEKQNRLENIVYGSCVVIFLVLGLVFNLFYISWVVFILGWVVILIFEDKENKTN